MLFAHCCAGSTVGNARKRQRHVHTTGGPWFRNSLNIAHTAEVLEPLEPPVMQSPDLGQPVSKAARSSAQDIHDTTASMASLKRFEASHSRVDAANGNTQKYDINVLQPAECYADKLCNAVADSSLAAHRWWFQPGQRFSFVVHSRDLQADVEYMPTAKSAGFEVVAAVDHGGNAEIYVVKQYGTAFPATAQVETCLSCFASSSSILAAAKSLFHARSDTYLALKIHSKYSSLPEESQEHMALNCTMPTSLLP